MCLMINDNLDQLYQDETTVDPQLVEAAYEEAYNRYNGAGITPSKIINQEDGFRWGPQPLSAKHRAVKIHVLVPRGPPKSANVIPVPSPAILVAGAKARSGGLGRFAGPAMAK
ncbi:hypothetical protein M5K25_012780 [Dendrobium thyrsiflorum]|uniref:Uncharacterized protein n=1 Tax=Dendrobium thyrsiflorum TaxID=117978 RepID=A0ABD0UYF0_DENTH